MLAEFEEYAESERYMHCLELAQFAEWREWDHVMEQDRDWNKLIQSRDDTILSFQLGALEDTLPTPSIRRLWYSACTVYFQRTPQTRPTYQHDLPSWCRHLVWIDGSPHPF